MCLHTCVHTYARECRVRLRARVRLNVPAVRFTPERISKRGGGPGGSWPGLGAGAVHVEVYEEVPRVIKFTGSVLHRVARVALCVCWIRRGGSERGSTNSVSGGQWLLW